MRKICLSTPESDGISPFYSVLHETLTKTVCNSFNNEKIKLTSKLDLDQLNKPFDLEEIKPGIKRLKAKKVPGISWNDKK